MLVKYVAAEAVPVQAVLAVGRPHTSLYSIYVLHRPTFLPGRSSDRHLSVPKGSSIIKECSHFNSNVSAIGLAVVGGLALGATPLLKLKEGTKTACAVVGALLLISLL